MASSRVIGGSKIQSIRDPSQLAELTVWRIMPSRASKGVVLETEGASVESVREWERQLNYLQNACGCEQGAFGLIIGMIGYIVYLFLRDGGWGHPGKHEFWVGLAVIVFSASVGKLLGLSLAQRRLTQVIREIQSQWKHRRILDQDWGSMDLRRMEVVVWATHCCGEKSTPLSPGDETQQSL